MSQRIESNGVARALTAAVVIAAVLAVLFPTTHPPVAQAIAAAAVPLHESAPSAWAALYASSGIGDDDGDALSERSVGAYGH